MRRRRGSEGGEGRLARRGRAGQERRPLDWGRFAARNARVPLRVLASSLAQGRAVVLDSAGGHFAALPELAACAAARSPTPPACRRRCAGPARGPDPVWWGWGGGGPRSMCLPAVAGDLARVATVEGLLADSQVVVVVGG